MLDPPNRADPGNFGARRKSLRKEDNATPDPFATANKGDTIIADNSILVDPLNKTLDITENPAANESALLIKDVEDGEDAKKKEEDAVTENAASEASKKAKQDESFLPPIE